MAAQKTTLPTDEWPEFPSGFERNPAELTLNPPTLQEQLEADHAVLRGEESYEVPKMPQEELKDFVLRYLAGDIFTSSQLRDPDLLSFVFLPLTFGALDTVPKEKLNDIGCIWAYYHEAMGSRSINGYPSFASCRFMHREDWARAHRAILIERERQKDIQI